MNIKFIEKDPEVITQEVFKEYEKITKRKLYPGQPESLMLSVFAYRESLVRLGVQDAAKQTLVNYARGEFLDELGALVGATRLPAKPAKIILSFGKKDPGSVFIEAGTRVRSVSSKLIFQTLESVEIIVTSEMIEKNKLKDDKNFYVNVEAECLTEGTIGNNLNDVTALISILEGVTVKNGEFSYGGADKEDDERFRQRIKESPEHFTVAGSIGAYRYHAMSASTDIIDVAITSNDEAGMVYVYVLVKESAKEDDVLAEVYKILSDEKVRPLTDCVKVNSVDKRSFKIEVKITVDEYASGNVKQDVQDALNVYSSSLKEKLGASVIVSQILAKVMSVKGVYNAKIVSVKEVNEDGETDITERDAVLGLKEVAICTFQVSDDKERKGDANKEEGANE